MERKGDAAARVVWMLEDVVAARNVVGRESCSLESSEDLSGF
jgi:hypothetical protein